MDPSPSANASSTAANNSNQKGPHAGHTLMMGAAHGNLAAPIQSPSNDAKQLATTAAVGFGSAPSDEKGFGREGGPAGPNGAALGMGGGAGRLGLDSNGNALTVHKRLPKEETV